MEEHSENCCLLKLHRTGFMEGSTMSYVNIFAHYPPFFSHILHFPPPPPPFSLILPIIPIFQWPCG